MIKFSKVGAGGGVRLSGGEGKFRAASNPCGWDTRTETLLPSGSFTIQTSPMSSVNITWPTWDTRCWVATSGWSFYDYLSGTPIYLSTAGPVTLSTTDVTASVTAYPGAEGVRIDATIGDMMGPYNPGVIDDVAPGDPGPAFVNITPKGSAPAPGDLVSAIVSTSTSSPGGSQNIAILVVQVE